MTIYSQHPNRGKIQILATYSDDAGLHSSTVTSVETSELAEPIVDTLNRISACLTLPVSVWDTRHQDFNRYPHEHLGAAADRSRRNELLNGAHSLWYEYVKMVLHEALEDLDKASAAVPIPIQNAIATEIATEVGQLTAALAEFSGDSGDDAEEAKRSWDSDLPTILFDGGLHELRPGTRERMNRTEERHLEKGVEESVDHLRLLFEAHSKCADDTARLDESSPSILVEPLDQSDLHGYFLSVDAPATFTTGPRGWQITVSKWIPDSGDPNEEEGSATGEPIVTCNLPSRPQISEIVDLLDQVGPTEDQLVEWSATPIGKDLIGTRFTVTERNDIEI